MNEHTFAALTQTYAMQIREGGAGVCLLTALYHCVAHHTSEGCGGNNGENSTALDV